MLRIPAKKSIKWILVANGNEAKILVTKVNKLQTDKTISFVYDKSRAQTHSLGTSKPGRVFDSVGVGRHSVEPKITLHEKAKQEFADQIAKTLNEASIKNEFDKLVLISSPEFLGEIRAMLKKQAIEKVVDEINKDLTQLNDDELIQLLGIKTPIAA